VNGAVGFWYIPNDAANMPGLRRRGLCSVLDTIGGLAVLDGPRRIREAHVMCGGVEVGGLVGGEDV